MIRPLALLPLCLLAACEDQADEAVARANSVEELSNRLDKLADRTSEDIEPAPRLADLRRADLPPAPGPGATCRMSRNGRLVLVVDEAGAVARIDGRRAALAVSGPVGPTGGFFTAPGITVSVGRKRSMEDGADGYGRTWPARLSLGGDPERPIEKHEGRWSCTRQGPDVTPPPG